MLHRQSAVQNLTYPDVLGMLSAGARLNTEAVQAAMGIYPQKVAAGQSFEVLVLLQNIFDQKCEGIVTIQLPKRDTKGERVIIFTAQDTIPVTLGPGEVALLHIPVTPQIPTPPAENYPFSVVIDFRRPRGKIIRDPSGGRVPGGVPMSPMRLNILRNEVGFGANQRSANTRLLNTLSGSFSVIPGLITARTANHTPRIETLWDAKALADDQEKYAVVEARTLHLSTSITRTLIYEPMINETERRFSAVNFGLLPGEAIVIAKVITYVLEDGLQVEPGFSLTESRWFQRLAAFIDDPDTLNTPSLLTRMLYLSAIHDAVRVGCQMVSRTMKQDIPPNEALAQASRVVDALEGRIPMTINLVYLPLALAGVMLLGSIRVPAENLWHTLDQIKMAWHVRSVSGPPADPRIGRFFDQFADNAEDFLVRTRVPR